MGKLRIRITNKDILKELPNGDRPALFHRELHFGIKDDLELMEAYDDTDEFIGHIDECKDGTFAFGIDRCNTSHFKTSSLMVLDAENKKDRSFYLLALKHDYGFQETDYVVL